MGENAARPDLTTCTEACEEALHECQPCATECVNEEIGKCALFDLDCAGDCVTELNVMARESAHHGDFCAHLRAECDKHSGERGHRKQCAAECWKHAVKADA